MLHLHLVPLAGLSGFFGEPLPWLHLHPLLLAGLTGLISGLILSIPVGPVNLTIMNEGAQRGFFWAAMIGLGATVMEVIYCGIAFTGFAELFNGKMMKASMELFSFVFMLFLGIKFLRTQSVPVFGPRVTMMSDRIEDKMHPHSAFMIGFVRVMANIGVFAFWILLAGTFVSHDLVEPSCSGKMCCVAGVATGTGLWFLVLSWGASLGHGKFTERTLLKMEHISGVGLLVLAFIYGARIVWDISGEHIQHLGG
jgi:threonine/homoserine/homoserine lactone efflux protein